MTGLSPFKRLDRVESCEQRNRKEREVFGAVRGGPERE